MFSKWKTEYPAPYQAFSPTYFYQSLYDVPHISHLLKDFNTFKFHPKKEQETSSWKAYQLDPYNPYMRGMMELMEDDSVCLDRRNNILDHLLARHGESPLAIDSLIKGSVYSGDSQRDAVTLKSLYLQNLGLLSYYRQKAYNFLGANKISGIIYEVPKQFKQQAFTGDAKDFIFNSEAINREEKLTDWDFVGYSAMELKLSLLLALKPCYKNFIAATANDVEATETAYWMLTERKGLIFVETALLWPLVDFEVIITQSATPGVYLQVGETLTYEEVSALNSLLQQNSGGVLTTAIQKGVLTSGASQYSITNVPVAMGQYTRFAAIPGTDYLYTVKIKQGVEIGSIETAAFFNNGVELLLPSFIPQFSTIEFSNRLDLFLQDTLPVYIGAKLRLADNDKLKLIIPAFAAWHNSLLYKDAENGEVDDTQQQRQFAGTLAGLITAIKPSEYGQDS